jgi:hypothetical protein
MVEKVINKKNLLLVKDDVGRAKPATRDLPPEGFTYGKADRRDHESAGIVTSSWKMHEQSKPQEAERDFKKLNKMSIKNGIIDAKNQKDFREKNDARIEQTIGDRSRRGRGLGVPENLAFGKANRPSTPINGIICNYYGETASHEIEEKYALSIELVSYTSLTVIYETEEANQGPSEAKRNQSPREGS